MIVHNTFVIERTLPVSVERVFAAWSQVEAKAKWFFGPPPWSLVKREFDFRVGGLEVLQGTFPGGHESLFTARYHHIVPNQEIVYAYDMGVDGRHISSTLATIVLSPAGTGTTMIVTEQGVFFEGLESASSREKGTAQLIAKLGASLV